jgi:hypothetical protein
MLDFINSIIFKNPFFRVKKHRLKIDKTEKDDKIKEDNDKEIDKKKEKNNNIDIEV